jgi:hypothetical protein
VSGLGIVESLGTSLGIAADTVVVAGGESIAAVEGVEGDSIVGGVVTEGSSETGDIALSDIVGSLTTEEEAVTTDDSIGSEGGTLNKMSTKIHRNGTTGTHPEDIEESARVETRLFPDGGQRSGLGSLLGGQSGVEVNLDTLGNLVLDLKGVAEDVGGSPGLGESQAMLAVGQLGLNVARDGVGLRVTVASDLEGDVGGSLSLDLKRRAVEGVVLAEQVVGGLSKILKNRFEYMNKFDTENARTFQEGGTG